jgi:hypothetical protein
MTLDLNPEVIQRSEHSLISFIRDLSLYATFFLRDYSHFDETKGKDHAVNGLPPLTPSELDLGTDHKAQSFRCDRIAELVPDDHEDAQKIRTN